MSCTMMPYIGGGGVVDLDRKKTAQQDLVPLPHHLPNGLDIGPRVPRRSNFAERRRKFSRHVLDTRGRRTHMQTLFHAGEPQ